MKRKFNGDVKTRYQNVSNFQATSSQVRFVTLKTIAISPEKFLKCQILTSRAARSARSYQAGI
jgi:hypothetical protein